MAVKVKFKLISFKILGIIGIVLLIYQGQGFCASASGLIGRGNQFYRKKAFNEAISNYKQAKDKFPESDIADFNLGTAYYQAKDFKQAKEAFTKSLITKDPLIEAKANYNIANTKSRQAQLEENSDVSKAIKLYEEAIHYYRRSIELDQKDPDPKFNYEFIEKRIEELRQQQQNQQPDQQQQQDHKDKDQQEQQQTQQQPNKNEQEQDSQSQPEGQEQNQQQQDSDSSQEDEMSQEQARLLLEGHRQQEEAGQKDKHKKALAYPHVLKDW